MSFVDTTPYKKKRKRSDLINYCSFTKIIAALIHCKACLCNASFNVYQLHYCSKENGWQPGKIKSREIRWESPKTQNRNDSDLNKDGSSADRKK